MVKEMNLQEEKLVQMKGKLVPIIKLERLTRSDLDGCIKWNKGSNSPSQNSCFPRWSKNMNKALKRLISIQFIRYTSPSLPPPFRVKKFSTDICDSSDELIPSYFFEEMVDSTNSLSSQAEEVSTVVNSIPSTVNEPKDDSIDALSFQLEEIGKAVVEVSLIILYNKLNCQNCFHIGLDESRSIFDRGKYAVVQLNYFGKLILSLGFKSDFGFLYLIIPLCVHDTEISVDGKLLAKMPEGLTWKLENDRDNFLLQLPQCKLFVKMHPLDSVYFELNFFSNHTLPAGLFSRRRFKYAATVFDRGKTIQLLKELFYFNCKYEDYLDTIPPCVIVIFGYCFDLLFGVSSVSLYVINDDNRAISQRFDTRPRQSSILGTTQIIRVPRQSEFGTELDLSAKLLAGFRLYFDKVFTSGSFILNVGSISMTYYNVKFVHRLICMDGFESDTLFCASLKLVLVPTSDYNDNSKLVAELSARNRFLFLLWSRLVSIRKGHTWFVHILGRKSTKIYFFQLPFELLKVLAVHLLCLIYVVDSEGACIPVWTSAGAPKFSCHIPLWSMTCGADIVVFPSAAVVFYELLMLIVARRGADVPLGEWLGVIFVEHGNTTTLSTLSQESHYLSMLVFSVPTSVRVFSLFSRFSYLLHVPYVSSSCMMPMSIIMGTQILVEVFQILKMLLWVGYLRWKFRLVPSGSWNTTSGFVFTWVFTELHEESCYTDQGWRNQALLCAHPSIGVKLLVLVNQWNSRDTVFCDVESHNPLAAILMRLSCRHLATAGRLFSFENGTGTRVCRHLLFDRGKMPAMVVMILSKHRTFGLKAPMYFPGECHGSSEILTRNTLGCGRLVFDRGKVQLTEKAPELFLNLHVVLTNDCYRTTLIMARETHNHLKTNKVTVWLS